MSTETATTAPKPSPVEGIKDTSRYLRGTLAEELLGPSDHFGEDNKQLLKFHGSYQQEDRDARKNRPKGGAAGKAYCFMIRLKLPGGKLAPKQYLALDEVAGRHANGTLRLTTRQSIQFHGVLKTNLKATIAEINDALVSTLGACGDVNRNVVTCPAPTGDPARVQMQVLADQIAEHLAPKSGNRAYHEIWLNGDKIEAPADAAIAEPIYGKHYLPRKFKVALALPFDNCTDLLAQCLGYMAVVENGKPVGYDLYVGGGQGMTNSKPDTYPLLAQPVAFLEPDEVVAASEAVIKLYRDHGNRSDRKRARMKYVMHDWGIAKYREVFARDYWKKPLRAPKEQPITGLDLHLGWHTQADGKWFLGVSVENGRISDVGSSASAPACGRSSGNSTASCESPPSKTSCLETSTPRTSPRSKRCSPSTASRSPKRFRWSRSGAWPAPRFRRARSRSPRANGRCRTSSTSSKSSSPTSA